MVYFVGHGLVGGRRHELYLGLPDSECAEPEFNSLEYDKLRSSLLDSAASTKIIILDCCFSGRAVNEVMADLVTEVVGQIEVEGTYVLASAERDQVALILPGEDHTAFTGRFLQLLRKPSVHGRPEASAEILSENPKTWVCDTFVGNQDHLGAGAGQAVRV